MYYLLYSLHNETENINSDILSRNLNCSIILPANFETVLCLDYRADWDPTYIKQREIFAAITQFSRDWMNDGHSSFISGRGYWRRTHAQDGASDKFRCCMWIRRTRRDPAWEKAPAGFACASQVAQTTRRVLLGTRDLCLSSNSLSPTRICIHVICPRAFRTNSDKLFEAARWFSCSRVAGERGRVIYDCVGATPTRQKSKLFFTLSALAFIAIHLHSWRIREPTVMYYANEGHFARGGDGATLTRARARLMKNWTWKSKRRTPFCAFD